MVKKYAPKKVFILKNNEYIEITYEELCHREENDPSYKDKLFLPLYGMIMEVTESTYIEFYKLQRRQKYIDERSRDIRLYAGILRWFCSCHSEFLRYNRLCLVVVSMRSQ